MKKTGKINAFLWVLAVLSFFSAWICYFNDIIFVSVILGVAAVVFIILAVCVNVKAKLQPYQPIPIYYNNYAPQIITPPPVVATPAISYVQQKYPTPIEMSEQVFQQVPEQVSEVVFSSNNNEMLLLNSNIINNGYEIKYSYDDVYVAFYNPVCILKKNDIVQIIPEPDNQNDKSALLVVRNGEKLGYIKKGRLQKMLNDYILTSRTFAACVDEVEPDKLTLCLYFYKPVDTYEDLLDSDNKKKIVKLSGNTSEDLQNNLDCLSVGDSVSFEYDFEKDKMSVVEFDTIGYVSDTISEYVDGLDKYSAFVHELDYNDNGKQYVKIIIFELE